MDRSRSAGAIICFVSAASALLTAVGIFGGNYWAVAIPVLAGVLVVMSLAFWIGWTMATTEIDAPAAPPRPPGEKTPSNTTDTPA